MPSHFDVEPGIHNLEAGYWSMMSCVVAQGFARHTAQVNSANSIWARKVMTDGTGLAVASRAAQGAIARQMGCAPEEIAITRSGAYALQMLISNYKPLSPGDGDIHCDLHYDVRIAAMKWLGRHRGATWGRSHSQARADDRAEKALDVAQAQGFGFLGLRRRF